jgi:hypothetical protein
MGPSQPQYEIDSPLGGGSAGLEAVFGPEDPSTRPARDDATNESEPKRLFWPKVPIQFEHPPEHLEETVLEGERLTLATRHCRSILKLTRSCQVGYLADMLEMTLCPSPLPEDDLQLCSDMLLSLETRDDLTTRVFFSAPADKIIARIVSSCQIPDEDEFNILSRIKALAEYWSEQGDKFRQNAKDAIPRSGSTFPPFLISLPVEKGPAWKFELNVERQEEAQKLYMAQKAVRAHHLSYFRLHPPAPMGWSPSGDALKSTPRQKMATGDLYDSPLWEPIYMDWALQCFDVPFNWKNPEEGAMTTEELNSARDFNSEWKRKKLVMKTAREARQE